MSELYLTYKESESGGEVAAGYENDDWPYYEDTIREWTPISLSLDRRPDDGWTETIQVDFKVRPNTGVYMVYVRYYDGGTFGRTCGYWMIIGVYKTAEEAAAVVKSIKDDTYTGYKHWDGYFAGLEDCGALYFKIEEPKCPATTEARSAGASNTETTPRRRKLLIT